MWRYFNPNPANKNVDDCMMRALCAAEGMSWLEAYSLLCEVGSMIYDLPNANEAFRIVLRRLGYSRHTIPNTCPDCYTVTDFCSDYRIGKYVLGTGAHVIAVIDGDYYDSSNSGNEVPLYFYKKER